MVLCGSAAKGDTSRPNAREVVSADGKRAKPAWQPERPAIAALAQPKDADANEPIEPAPLQDAADGPRGESRPAASATSTAGNQGVAPVGSALVERPSGARNVVIGGGEIEPSGAALERVRPLTTSSANVPAKALLLRSSGTRQPAQVPAPVDLEPLGDQPLVIDPDSSWTDGGEYSYSPAPFGTDLPMSGDGDGFLWKAVSRLQLFAGVHGFKGPTDQGRNGNFGFHEGLNFGAPLWDLWGYGYQAGFQALHSNFAGNQAVQTGPLPSLDAADRNQVFLTGGIFKRPLGTGWQTGVAFDVFFDSYYARSTLYQLRSETAFVLSDLSEIGYWGAYGLNKETITGFGQLSSTLNPTDLFAVFYRRRFTGGGRGRLWAGLSGNGDAICGLDGTVPLGTSWALDNNFTWLLPKEGPRSGGQTEESWSVSIQLVWYPGRQACEVFDDPYHPLFYVADNSWFLVDRRQ